MDKPNIIFIFADDWGYGDLSLHGSDFVKTPHIDRMAAEGIDFQSFTVNSPVCSPSRVAAISGQFPARFCIHQHFAGVNSNKKRGMPDWLDPEAPMLPRILKEAGYKTGHFGKWHLGKAEDSPVEDAYGYDAFATFNGSGRNEIRPEGLASVDHAEVFIKENKDQPFFINLWLHEVHLAHFPLDKYLKKFKDLDEQKRVYASVIAEGDEGVGRILALLKDLNLDEKTLVVFSSDNGAEAAGIDMPKGFEPDGQSALAAFKGEPFKRIKPIFWEWRGGVSKKYTWPSLGIRDGRWKLLVNKELEKLELYDLESDWGEKKNVSANHPEIVQKLSKKLDAWKKTLPKKPSGNSVSSMRVSKK